MSVSVSLSVCTWIGPGVGCSLLRLSLLSAGVSTLGTRDLQKAQVYFIKKQRAIGKHTVQCTKQINTLPEVPANRESKETNRRKQSQASALHAVLEDIVITVVNKLYTFVKIRPKKRDRGNAAAKLSRGSVVVVKGVLLACSSVFVRVCSLGFRLQRTNAN